MAPPLTKTGRKLPGLASNSSARSVKSRGPSPPTAKTFVQSSRVHMQYLRRFTTLLQIFTIRIGSRTMKYVYRKKTNCDFPVRKEVVATVKPPKVEKRSSTFVPYIASQVGYETDNRFAPLEVEPLPDYEEICNPEEVLSPLSLDERPRKPTIVPLWRKDESWTPFSWRWSVLILAALLAVFTPCGALEPQPPFQANPDFYSETWSSNYFAAHEAVPVANPAGTVCCAAWDQFTRLVILVTCGAILTFLGWRVLACGVCLLLFAGPTTAIGFVNPDAVAPSILLPMAFLGVLATVSHFYERWNADQETELQLQLKILNDRFRHQRILQKYRKMCETWCECWLHDTPDFIRVLVHTTEQLAAAQLSDWLVVHHLLTVELTCVCLAPLREYIAYLMDRSATQVQHLSLFSSVNPASVTLWQLADSLRLVNAVFAHNRFKNPTDATAFPTINYGTGMLEYLLQKEMQHAAVADYLNTPGLRGSAVGLYQRPNDGMKPRAQGPLFKNKLETCAHCNLKCEAIDTFYDHMQEILGSEDTNERKDVRLAALLTSLASSDFVPTCECHTYEAIYFVVANQLLAMGQLAKPRFTSDVVNDLRNRFCNVLAETTLGDLMTKFAGVGTSKAPRSDCQCIKWHRVMGSLYYLSREMEAAKEANSDEQQYVVFLQSHISKFGKLWTTYDTMVKQHHCELPPDDKEYWTKVDTCAEKPRAQGPEDEKPSAQVLGFDFSGSIGESAAATFLCDGAIRELIGKATNAFEKWDALVDKAQAEGLPSVRKAADAVSGSAEKVGDLAQGLHTSFSSAERAVLLSTVAVQILVFMRTKDKYLLFSVVPQVVVLLGGTPQVTEYVTSMLTRSASDKGVIEGQGPGGALERLLGIAIALLFGKIPDKGTRSMVLDILRAIVPAQHLAGDFAFLLKGLPKLLPACIQAWLYHHFPSQFAYSFYEHPEFERICLLVDHWTTPSNKSKFVESHDSDNIFADYITLQKWRQELYRTKEPVPNSLQDVMKRAAELVNLKYRASTRQRAEPFCISFVGNPGVGKSFLSKVVALRLLPQEVYDQVKKLDTETDQAFFARRAKTLLQRHVYARNSGVKHWDDYNGEHIVLYDDQGQTDTVNSQAEGNDYVEFMQIISSNPLMLPMAALDEKGHYFRSKIVIANTNKSHPECTSVAVAAAVYRRRHLLIEVEPRFTKPGTHLLDPQAVRADCNHLILRKLDPLQAGVVLREYANANDFFNDIAETVQTHFRIGFDTDSLLADITPLPDMIRPVRTLGRAPMVQTSVEDPVRETVAQRKRPNAQGGKLRKVDLEESLPDDDYQSAIGDEDEEVTDSFAGTIRERLTNRDGVVLDFAALVGLDSQESELVSALDSTNWREARHANKLQMAAALKSKCGLNVRTCMLMLSLAGPLSYMLYLMYTKYFTTAVSLEDRKKPVMEIIKTQAQSAVDELAKLDPDAALWFNDWLNSGPGKLKLDEAAELGRSIGESFRNHYLDRSGKPFNPMDLPWGVGTDGSDYWMENGDGTRLTQGPRAYDPRVHHRVRPRARIPRTQGPVDDGVIDRIRRNYVSLMGPWGGDAIALGVAGRWMLVNRHYFECLDRHGEIVDRPDGFKFVVQRRGTFTNHVFERSRLVEHDSELFLYELEPTIGEFSDIRKHLCSIDVATRRKNHECLLMVPRFTRKDGVCPEMSYFNVVAQWTEGPREMIVGGNTCRNIAASGDWSYGLRETYAGMCGSILWAKNDRMQRKIIGMHVAGDRDAGYSCGFDLDFIMATTGNCVVENDESIWRQPYIVDDVDPRPQVQGFLDPDTGYSFPDNYEILASVMPVRFPSKSGLKESRVHGCLPVHKRPSVLIPTEVDDIFIDWGQKGRALLSPLVVGLGGFGFLLPATRQSCVDLVRGHMTSRFRALLPTAYRRTYSVREAIQRDDFLDGIDRINMHSSVGYPMILDKLPGQSGKLWLFEDPPECTKPTVYMENLIRTTEHFLEQMKKGVRPPLCFTASLKDELLKISKVEQAKTRLFMASCLVQTLLARCLNNGFFGALHAAGYKCGVSVGIDVHTEWNALFHYLASHNNKWIVGDYSKYDKRLPNQCLYAAAQIISDWVGDGPEMALARQTLMSVAVHKNVVVGNTLYRIGCGMPSGTVGTVDLNSLVNEMMARLCWHYLAPVELKTQDHFDEHIRMVANGDDFIAVPSDEVLDFFNGKSLASFVKQEFGLDLIDESKSAEMHEWKSPTDCTFLKRSFRKDGDLVLPPLDRVSLESMVSWISNDGDDDALTVLNCQTALKEAVYHGKAYFDSIEIPIRMALEKNGLKAILPTYADERVAISERMLGPRQRPRAQGPYDRPRAQGPEDPVETVTATEIVENIPLSEAVGGLTWEEEPAKVVSTPAFVEEPETLSSEAWSQESFMQRRFFHSNPAWTNANTADTKLFSFELPSAVLSLESAKWVIDQMTYLKTGITIFINHDSNFLFVGKLIAGFVPFMTNLKDGYTAQDLLGLPNTQIIDVSRGEKEYAFKIPYQSLVDALRTEFTGTNWPGEQYCMGTFICLVYTPLQNPAALKLVVSVQFDGVEVSALRVIRITKTLTKEEKQKRKQENRHIYPVISMEGRNRLLGLPEAQGAKTTKEEVTNITINNQGGKGDFAHIQDRVSKDTMTSSATTDVKATATVPPMDYPALPHFYVPTYEVPSQFTTVTSGANFQSAHMAFEVGDVRMMHDRHLGYSEDENLFTSFRSKPTIVERLLNWPSSAASGTILWQMPICPIPNIIKNMNNTTTPFKVGYMEYLANLRLAWHGTLKYQFSISCDGYARGRLALAIVYGQLTPFPAGTTFQQIENQNIHYMHLADNARDFEVEVPYKHSELVRRLHGPDSKRIAMVATGYLVLMVINPFSGSALASCNMVITQTYGDDFMVGGWTTDRRTIPYTQLGTTPPPPKAQGPDDPGALGEAEAATLRSVKVAMGEAVAKPIPETSPLGRDEMLMHLTDFSKRLSKLGTWKTSPKTPSGGTAVLNELVIPIFSQFWGGKSFTANPHPQTLHEYIGMMFYGFCGDFRYIISCVEGNPFEVRWVEEVPSFQTGIQVPEEWVGKLSGNIGPLYVPVVRSPKGVDVYISTPSRYERGLIRNPSSVAFSSRPTDVGSTAMMLNTVPLWYDGSSATDFLQITGDSANTVMGFLVISARTASTFEIWRAPSDHSRNVRLIGVPRMINYPVAAKLTFPIMQGPMKDLPRAQGPGAKLATGLLKFATDELMTPFLLYVRQQMSKPYVAYPGLEEPKQIKIAYGRAPTPQQVDQYSWLDWTEVDLTQDLVTDLQNGVLQGKWWLAAGDWSGFTGLLGDVQVSGKVQVDGSVPISNWPSSFDTRVTNFPTTYPNSSLQFDAQGNLKVAGASATVDLTSVTNRMDNWSQSQSHQLDLIQQMQGRFQFDTNGNLKTVGTGGGGGGPDYSQRLQDIQDKLGLIVTNTATTVTELTAVNQHLSGYINVNLDRIAGIVVPPSYTTIGGANYPGLCVYDTRFVYLDGSSYAFQIIGDGTSGKPVRVTNSGSSQAVPARLVVKERVDSEVTQVDEEELEDGWVRPHRDSLTLS